MTTNIKQDDFFVCDNNGKGEPIAVSNADSLNTFKVSAEVVIFQVWLKWIIFLYSKKN